MSVSCEFLRAMKDPDGGIRCDLVGNACCILDAAIDANECNLSFLEHFGCGFELWLELLTWFTEK